MCLNQLVTCFDYNHYADVIGRVIACDDLDNHDKNGRAGKKKPLTLIDVEYVILISFV